MDYPGGNDAVSGFPIRERQGCESQRRGCDYGRNRRLWPQAKECGRLLMLKRKEVISLTEPQE